MSLSAARSSRTRRLLPNMASSSATWPVSSAYRLRGHPECRSEVGSGAAPQYEQRDTARIPDAMIRCGQHPRVLFEVVSPSELRHKRQWDQKRADLQAVEGVQEIVEIYQDEMLAHAYRRHGARLGLRIDRRTGGTDGAAQRRHHASRWRRCMSGFRWRTSEARLRPRQRTMRARVARRNQPPGRSPQATQSCSLESWLSCSTLTAMGERR